MRKSCVVQTDATCLWNPGLWMISCLFMFYFPHSNKLLQNYKLGALTFGCDFSKPDKTSDAKFFSTFLDQVQNVESMLCSGG